MKGGFRNGGFSPHDVEASAIYGELKAEYDRRSPGRSLVARKMFRDSEIVCHL